MITKSDFLVYFEAPIHFWALKHEKTSIQSPSLFDQHLFEQGKKAEALTRVYVYSEVFSRYEKAEILWQPTYKTEHLEARADAVIHDLDTDAYDLYEIKSSTQIKPEHKYDISFQAYVCGQRIVLRNHYIIHVNKDYVREGDIDTNQLFVTVNVNEIVAKLIEGVAGLAQQAIAVEALASPSSLEPCFKPRDCDCPAICHPDLPEGSIYEINGLRINKKQELRTQSIETIVDIQTDFKLPSGQARQVEATKKGEILVFEDELLQKLNGLAYPLYFLDYEAFNPSVPYFDGYKPYQYIPFQYSLHVLEAPGADLVHYEFLDLDEGDSGIRMTEDLETKIGPTGSIVVWNRTFEKGRHTEMAARYPQFASTLENWNERIFDLMVPFQKGMYADPAVKGSYSIKNVLPAVVPDKSYAQLELSNGTEAMLLWDRIIRGEVPEAEIPAARQRLLEYCELDTLAMVEILRFLEGVTK